MSKEFGLSPLQDLLELYHKIVTDPFLPPKEFYYIAEEKLPLGKLVYTFTGIEGIKVSVFQIKLKNIILEAAKESGFECIDYQEFCKTEKWQKLFLTFLEARFG